MEEVFRANSINATLVAAGLVFILTVISLFIKEKTEFISGLLFWSMVLVIVANTLFLAGSTIYLNSKSITGGPVHWHADFEIWDCGQKVEFIPNPKGLSNKIGTPTLHEHNDGRIHLEGVVTDYSEITLGRFFEVAGWELTNESLTKKVVGDGVYGRRNGETCNTQADMLGLPGELQVFVYNTEANSFSQQKLSNPTEYIMSPYSQVPPGDCIIIEFDTPKEKTDKLCNFYKVAIQKGELQEQNGN
jgi:hypothetical protein